MINPAPLLRKSFKVRGVNRKAPSAYFCGSSRVGGRQWCGIKLGAQQLRTTKSTDGERKKIKKNPIYIILDNVMDTYNIGSIFRLADAVAAKRILLCGETETPPHTRIKKASINTTEWVEWEHFETAKSAIKNLKLKIKNLRVIAIEQSEKSVSYDKVKYDFPIALVVGHETLGVSKEVLQMCDQIAEIPMWGVNISLNVMVSLAIILFEAMNYHK